MSDEELEYYRELINNDNLLKHLPEDLKNEISYFDWTAYCGYGDKSRPVSKIVKRVRLETTKSVYKNLIKDIEKHIEKVSFLSRTQEVKYQLSSLKGFKSHLEKRMKELEKK